MDMVFKKLLVPVDFSDGSVAAISTASRLAPQGSIYVLHVLPPLPLVSGNLIQSASKTAHDKQQALDRLTSCIAGVAEATPLVRFGDAAEECTAAARELCIDLIVIPAQSHSKLEHLLLGSVTHGVLRHSPCPVLVLPTHTGNCAPG